MKTHVRKPGPIDTRRSEVQCSGGFTLVELLVVIAIIAVLASLWMPGLAKAKSKAESTVCLNQLRQLQLAWLTYTFDDEDALPPNRIDALRNAPIEPSGKTRYSQLLQPPPAEVFVFPDVHEQSIDTGGFNLHPLVGSWGHLPADRHNRGSNLSFADGHAEYYHWRAPKVFVSERQYVQDPNDQADFKRLAAGMPFQR